MNELVKSSQILTGYKTIDEKKIDRLLQMHITKCNKKIVVLDDDPTGVQTVHGVFVYTDWMEDSIRQGFENSDKMFYILTNSRGFTEEQTTRCHREIAERTAKIAKETGQEYIMVSRGDSTLRGHYPLETELLRSGFEADGQRVIDGEIMCPFFKEGGRYTIDNIHYVKYGEKLIPVGQTEFAGDQTFGYASSNLCEYIGEKTKGVYPESEVTCISLESLRNVDIDKILAQLLAVKHFGKVVVNAIDYCDLKVFAIALYEAMEQGKNYMLRTAAALVKVLGGISDQPLLTRQEMIVHENGNGGIIVVGSHTQKTTDQLEALKSLEKVKFLEFNSDLVLEEDLFQKEITKVLKLEDELIQTGQTVVVFTKRKLLTLQQDTKEAALLRSVKISDAVQSLVGRLSVVPSFVIAKGGITSSDIGTKALQVKKAYVMGQVKPGIPVWQTGSESRFPLTPYIIFPGNVELTNTLKEVVEILL